MATQYSTSFVLNTIEYHTDCFAVAAAPQLCTSAGHLMRVMYRLYTVHCTHRTFIIAKKPHASNLRAESLKLLFRNYSKQEVKV